MNKPKDYDNVKTGDFERLNVGPHIAVIKDVDERKSESGRDMLVVSIDFDKSDEQAGYFKKSFDNDTRTEKKWPFQAVSYILTNDAEGKTSRSFKAFCTSFEESNNIEIAWGDDSDSFCKQFRGRKIGVMYGEVEEEWNGQVNMRTRIRWFFDAHKIDSQITPLPKHLKTEAGSDSWLNAPETGKEALPFA